MNQALNDYWKRLQEVQDYLLYIANQIMIELPEAEIYHMEFSENPAIKINFIYIFHQEKCVCLGFISTPYSWLLRGKHRIQNSYDDFFESKSIIENMTEIDYSDFVDRSKEKFLKRHNYLIKFNPNEKQEK